MQVAKKDQMSSDGDHSNKQLISLLLTIKNEAKSRKRKVSRLIVTSKTEFRRVHQNRSQMMYGRYIGRE